MPFFTTRFRYSCQAGSRFTCRGVSVQGVNEKPDFWFHKQKCKTALRGVYPEPAACTEPSVPFVPGPKDQGLGPEDQGLVEVKGFVRDYEPNVTLSRQLLVLKSKAELL